MTSFTVHDETTAPEAARPLLEQIKKSSGIIPSLFGVMAENPAALEAYTNFSKIFGKAGFSPLEQQVVLITASVENECHFCVAAHSTLSAGSGLDMDVIHAVRDDRPIDDDKLEALRLFTKKVVVQRGFVSEADTDAFLEAGYTRGAVLGVILGVSLKVISNYTNHVAETPVDAPFQKYAWTPPGRAVAAE